MVVTYRVLPDPHRVAGMLEWRCVDGVREYRLGKWDVAWKQFHLGRNPNYNTPARVAMWLDLALNPLEP